MVSIMKMKLNALHVNVLFPKQSIPELAGLFEGIVLNISFSFHITISNVH